MALLGLRESTMDVDTITQLDATLRQAVTEVARDFDLDPGWLNDRAFAFRPQIELTLDEPLFEHPNLVIDGPTPDYVFLMKLGRGAQRDRGDLVALWPRTTFGSPEAVARAYEAAYPHLLHDEYLAGYVAEIAAAAAR